VACGRAALRGLVFLVVITLGVHIRAAIFRARAEHLLAVLKTFRVEQTPASTILELRRTYRPEIVERGACSEAHCQFSIDLTEWVSTLKLDRYPWVERAKTSPVNLLRPFGLRPSELEVDLMVEGGKLRGLDVRFMHAYVKRGHLTSSIAADRTAGNFNGWIDGEYIYQHPNLVVREPHCTGCNGVITADFTWEASHEEFERALGFSFSCITSFHVCSTAEDLMPSAAQQFKEDRARLSANMNWRMPCDTRTARILGRDSDFVNLVTVKGLKSDENDEYIVADYDPLRALKGERVQMKNIYHQKALAEVETANSGLPQHLLRLGAERIVFLSNILGKPAASSDCAVMADTPENLAAALEGIAADRTAEIDQN